MYYATRLKSSARHARKWIGQAAARVAGKAHGQHVVFLAGVQRSGTNMVMDILERSPDTKVFHESDRRAFIEFQLRGDAILRRLARSAARCVIFKALCDAHRLTTLMDQFQSSSAIWVYRHFDEVVSSHLALWPQGRNQIDKLVKDRSAAKWRGLAMTDETWDLVKRHYHPDMGLASAQALFWYYRNQLFFDQELDGNACVYLVKYEDIAGRPHAEIEQLASFLGIRTTAGMAAYVAHGSTRRKPPQPVDLPIRKLCEEMMNRLDVVLSSREHHPALVNAAMQARTSRTEFQSSRS
jgi:Sulfotransferase domain